MTMSTWPLARPSLVFLASAAGTSRDSRPTSIGKPCSRSTKLRVMLAGEQGGRADQRHLHARHRDDERGAQRDLGLAEADIAAHQPVHRLARLRGRRARPRSPAPGRRSPHRGSGRRTAGRRESGSATTPGRVARSAAVLISSPAISRMRSFIRDLRRCHASPPSRSSVDAVALAAVAGQQLDILDRHVELVAAGIFERDAIVRRLADLDRGQPLVAADAMVGVDDEVARRQRRQLGQEGGGALALLAAADQPVAEHVLLGQDGDIGRGEAVVERQDEQRRRRPCAPSASCQLSASFSDLRPWSSSRPCEPLARARRVARQHDLAAVLPQRLRHASATAS